jgi:hypothetical protein
MGHISIWSDDDDVNLLGEIINIIKKITETVFDASKEVGLEVNAEKSSIIIIIFICIQ